MKLWTGVITELVAESRDFYVRLFGCTVIFDSDWFVLLSLGGGELGFLKPDLPTQSKPFRAAYPGRGMWITIDVDDVDAQHVRLVSLGIPIEVPIRTEEWGERHFVIRDPNGIGVDIVTRGAPEAA
ncbi:MAG: VOC family protein [Gemmatimonadales bacterium]